MREVSLALAAAFFYGLTYVLARLAARDVTPLLGGLITSAVVAAIFLPWVIFTVPIRAFGNPSLLWYAGLGVFVPGIARSFHFAGIERIGAAPSSLVRGTGPLLSSALAILLLGETISGPVAGGTGLIILGIAVLSIRKEEMRSWALSGILYALVATLIFVFRDLIIRHAAPQTPSKGLAIFIMAVTSTLVIGGAWLWFDKKNSPRFRSGVSLYSF